MPPRTIFPSLCWEMENAASLPETQGMEMYFCLALPFLEEGSFMHNEQPQSERGYEMALMFI